MLLKNSSKKRAVNPGEIDGLGGGIDLETRNRLRHVLKICFSFQCRFFYLLRIL